jgi:hypothetical protein
MSVTAENRKYFVDVFMDWCASVRSSYDTGNVKPYSYYGSVLEIVSYLNAKSDNNLPRYPMIALADNEGLKQIKKDDWYEVSPTIYIFSETQEKYDPQQRYTNVIKPILFPLKELLSEVIEHSDSISPANEVDEPIFEIFKGSLNGMTIPDTVDCIKLNFSNLRIKNNC